MAKKSNVIEINGRKYDASTGQLLVKKTSPKTPASSPKVDGFAKVITAKPRAKQTGKVLTPKEVKKEARRRAKHAKELHKPASKSKTLVRSFAQKSKKRSFRTKILTSATAFTEGAQDGAKDEMAKSVSSERLKHAKSNKQSASITKFASSEVISKSANNQHVSSVAKTSPVTMKNQLIAEQMAKIDTSTSKKSKKKARKNPIKGASDYVKKSPKITTIVATSLAALMLFGYITYLNVPNMALRVAAVKAGFSANMPGYSPNGYRFTGPIAYSPGQITIQFSSNTDDRAYDITQRQTNWDSKSLLDNFVKKEVASEKLYLTMQDRGLTLYIYNKSNATWVNGGIWYTITGDALLNGEQLRRIAASL